MMVQAGSASTAYRARAPNRRTVPISSTFGALPGVTQSRTNKAADTATPVISPAVAPTSLSRTA